MDMMDYDKYLTRKALLSQPSPIRLFHAMVLDSPEPLINMAPGLPNDDRMPIVGGKFNLRDGTTIELDKADMRVAQQYNRSDGIPPLREWVTDLTVQLHRPPTYADKNKDKALRVIVNAGAIHGVSGSVSNLVNPGDKVLVSDYYYAATVEIFRRNEAVTVSLKSESDGPDIQQLEKILSQYDPSDQEKWRTRPKMLYTVPNGNNPSGESTSLEKRKKIYSLAQKYDFIIVEDDSYYFLQFNEERLPSYLSMDIDGRVIRCDSFSKVIGAGFRIGWVSGPSALVTRIFYELQYTIQHASIFSQVVVNKLVRQWGVEEFIRKADDMRDFYRHQRDIAVHAADIHLKEFATWDIPQSGMFLWIKLTCVKDSHSFISSFAIKNRFMTTPGGIFTLENHGPCPYLRIAFSNITEAEIEEGIKRLATALREATGFQSTSDHKLGMPGILN